MDETKVKKYIRKAISGLTILTYVLTLCGLILTGILKLDNVSQNILPFYPRYQAAMKAVEILAGEPSPITMDGEILKDKDGNEVLATALGSDSPYWPVMLDFMKSEIAIRRSDIITTAIKYSHIDDSVIYVRDGKDRCTQT